MTILRISLSLAAMLVCVASTYQGASMGFSLSKRPPFNIYTEHPATTVVNVKRRRGYVPPTLDDRTRIALTYLQQTHGILPSLARITNAYTDQASGVTHVYAKQVVDGIPIANGLANVNIDRNGRVISASQSFVLNPTLSAADAIEFWTRPEDNKNHTEQVSDVLQSLASHTDLDFSSHKITICETPLFSDNTKRTIGLSENVASDKHGTIAKEYLQLKDGRIAPVWHICVQHGKYWLSAYVDANSSSKVHAVCDWAYNYEAYNVLPRNITSLDDGAPLLVADPATTSASPHGWATGNTTAGNNVWAQANPSDKSTWMDSPRPAAKGAPNKVFDFSFNAAQEPENYANFAVTQLFYTVNVMHDLSFVYGFDEAAGNFQDINFSGKGADGDYVVAFAQNGGGTNNAMFFSPPDGMHGVMKMYLWTSTSPKRDGDLEQDIVAHEFTHGISSRLTGGPSNPDCLADRESGGLSEGWSDIVANILRIKPGMTRGIDMEMGRYVNGKNIRMYPYSTSMVTNPQTFKYLDRENYKEVHAIGEVWATMLYEVLWNLIDASGISEDLFKHDMTKGNCIMLQILLNGMKLQPCNPSFIDARKAIVQAEQNLTGGKYKCAIWRGFAKRGLGTGASEDRAARTEDFGVPPECGGR